MVPYALFSANLCSNLFLKEVHKLWFVSARQWSVHENWSGRYNLPSRGYLHTAQSDSRSAHQRQEDHRLSSEQLHERQLWRRRGPVASTRPRLWDRQHSRRRWRRSVWEIYQSELSLEPADSSVNGYCATAHLVLVEIH